LLEVAFSESVAGSLKYAIGRKKGDIVENGAVAVFCDDPQEKEQILAEMQKPKIWQGGEIEGRSCDVVSLHLQLDFGDLSALQDDPAVRKDALDELFGQYPGVSDDLIASAKQALGRIFEADEIRMWIGEQDACDIAAAFWVCHLLRRKDFRLQIVYIPMLAQEGKAVCRFGGAGDLEPEKLSLHADAAHEITPEMKRYMANRWCEIKEENAPLRMMVNGMLTGVPENIYDRVLKASAPEGEFRLGMMIGRALDSTRGVGDSILNLRVTKWLADGTLETVSAAKDGSPYSAVVRRGPLWR